MKKLIFILAFLICSSEAQAVSEIFYVSTLGSDANSCATSRDQGAADQTKAKRNVTGVLGGLECLQDSDADILDIRAGTYVETIRYQTLAGPVGSSWANAPVIRGHAAETVTIRGVNISETAAWKYIKFENLIIDANESVSEAVQVGASSLSLAPSFIRFTNCEAKNSNAAGAVQFGRCTGCEWIGDGIAGNSAGRIRDNGDHAGQDHGIYIYGPNSIVDGAEITGNCAYGIHAYGSSMTNVNNGLIVRNTYVHDNATCGDAGSASGIIVTQSTNALVYNNISEGNLRGIMLGLGSATPSGVGVYNNSIYGNTVVGILINSNSSNNLLQNNITYSNGTNISNNGLSTICTANLGAVISGCVTHGTSTNPFTNAAGDDFTLATGSAAIGTGTNLCSIFTTDFNGAARDCTSPEIWDLGAIKAPTTPTLTLLTPNGGNLGQTGSMQTFTWSRTDEASVPNVRLLYDGAYDGTFNATSTLSATTTNDGSFDFTAPTVTTTGRFRVEDVVDGIPFDESDANVTITAAAGGSITLLISNNTSGTKIGNIGGVTSALLGESTPNFNFGIGSGIRANKFGVGSHSHSVLRFPTNSIPTNATVTAAEIGLYRTADNATVGATSIDFRNNKRAFVQNEATWTIYSTGNNWGTPGGLNATDRDSAVVCNMSIPAIPLATYYTCSSAALTAWTQDLVNLSTPNNGLHLERNGTGNDGLVRTFGAENPTAAYLSITYTTTAPTITLTSPISGAHFFPGKIIPIHWQSQGISGNVRILMSPNAGLSYTEIEDSHPLGQVDFIWQVPPMQSSSSVVFKVESLNDSAVSDTSDAIRIGGRRTGWKQ